MYIFDVDGTLTPARRPIRPKHRELLAEWMSGRVVYFITGSDISKLREQLDTGLLSAAAGYFTCAGAEHWSGGRTLSRRLHRFPGTLYEMLDGLLAESPYPHRFGNHVEERTGMINFSIVGRDAPAGERKAYFDWDSRNGERREFVGRLRAAFPAYAFSTGGEISIDIVPAGRDKAQIVPLLLAAHPESHFVFVGNRLGPDGNDRPLAAALGRLGSQHLAIEVRDDEETFRSLSEQAV